MRLAILSLTVVVLIATVNGNTVLEKIKEKLTPSSHHDEHHQEDKSVLPDRKQISERLRPSPPSLDEEHRLREEHHEKERGRDESSFVPPPSLKSGEMNVREHKDKRQTEEHQLPSTDLHERVEHKLNPLKPDEEKLRTQNPSDVHQEQRSENVQESQQVDPSSSDQQTSEVFFKGFIGRPYYGGYGYRHYGYGYPYYRTYGYYPGYYNSYYCC